MPARKRTDSPGATRPDDGSEADVLPPPVETLLAQLEARLAVAAPDLARIEADLAALEPALRDLPRADHRARACGRLARHLTTRAGPAARALYRFLAARVRESTDARAWIGDLLDARDTRVRADAADLVLERIEAARLTPDRALARQMAREVETEGSALQCAEGLMRIGYLLAALGPAGQPPVDDDPVVALFLAREPSWLRGLAARVLDRTGEPVPSARAERLLGAGVAAALAPYLEFTRATHRDLVDITPVAGEPPPVLPSLVAAEAVLGPKLLSAVIAELGWSRLCWGISAERLIGLEVGGSFPFALRPEEADLLEAAGPTRQRWERFLVITHGGREEAELPGAETGRIQRFRRYNLVHAEVLEDILEIAPLTPTKVRRILDRMETIVTDFVELFSEHAADAARLPAVHAALRAPVEEALRDHDESEPLAAEATRRVQMFEDPRTLDEVGTLHGLKRYLHQQGLRLAFRLFRSARTTNRTVDLVLTDTRRILHATRPIRYLDFEPDPDESAVRLPFPVALATDALGRQLVHGQHVLPQLEILRYGNEVQVYVYFRNHPVFIRLDLSPPLRGGMVDLEFYGVSQYEVDHHPDVRLEAIRHLIRRIEFDVEKNGLRLHARYDKERALDLGDLIEKARALFRLLPHVMDLDWIIGGLDYPEPTRRAVSEAWAEFFLRWGTLPVAEFLTSDRRRILRGIEPDPAGEREVPWNGRGHYTDRFTGSPSAGLFDGLRDRLEARGLDSLAVWVEERGQGPAQLPLERAVLRPLRDALVRGEIVATRDGLRPVPPARFRRVHDAVRLAEVLSAGGPDLTRARHLARVVASIERQFRFRTTGSIEDHRVEHALLPLRGESIGIFVLRDPTGLAALALATIGDVLFRRRPTEDSVWNPGRELDADELIRRLRRDNYLARGFVPPDSEPAETTTALAAALRRPNPAAAAVPWPDERVLPGITASPGRAAGFARFGPTRVEAAELDGSVLFAPVLQPEDAPLLRRAVGMVTTGGGVLSHLGLIALELQKPAMIVAGQWRTEAGGSTALACRRAEFRIEESLVEGLRVVRRQDLREREETLREGDLVVVDADAATLSVLGQDRDALALHQDLRQMEEAAAHLALLDAGAEVLEFRGRWLRAVHQLERLLARIDRPALARHAVRELLETGTGATASGLAAGPERRRLLGMLFENRRCGGAARETAGRRFDELARRHGALLRETQRAVPELEIPLEILFWRREALRRREVLRAVAEALAEAGPTVAPGADEGELDAAVRRRLEELEAGTIRDLELPSGPDGIDWRARHRVAQLERLTEVLGHDASGKAGSLVSATRSRLVEHDDRCAARVAGRRVVGPADGGHELAPLVGAKAATLGELARALGPADVPEWFAITDRAFREVLALPPPPRALEALGLDRQDCPSLERTIEAILAHNGSDAGRQAATIRELWSTLPLPRSVEAEVAAAYRRLGEAAGTEEPAVAIRSSAFEEDTASTAWAGQFDTFLYVRGERAVLDHLKLAWAGLWGARALDQRRRLGRPGRAAGGGVIVQRMIDARVSGVVHTACVTTGQLGEMVINVGLGLGEGVVSGRVDVDLIHVVKGTGEDRDPLRFRYHVGDKREQVVCDPRTGLGTRHVETLYHQRLRPALEYVELAEIVRTAGRLERDFGEPLDLEFAIEGSKLHVLQARPVAVFHAAWRDTVDRHPLGPEGGIEEDCHDSP